MLANDILIRDKRQSSPQQDSKSTLYGCLLGVIKLCKCIGIYVISDLLKSVHVVQLLFFLKFGASIVLLPLQKPLQGKRIHKSHWRKVVLLSLFGCLVNILWFYGITLCGPLRSILIFENSPPVVIAALTTLVRGKSTPAKVRGTVLLALGFLSLLLLDKDISLDTEHAETHAHHSGLNHVFYHSVHWFGLPDHKAGVLLLLSALLMETGYDNAFRKISLEVGGSKRLYALSTIVSAIALAPLACITFFIKNYIVASWLEFSLGVAIAVAFVLIADFYTESICSQHLSQSSPARWCPILMFVFALILGQWWFEPYRTATTESVGPGYFTVEHGLSGGVVVAVVFLVFGTYILTTPHTPRAMAGTFIGWSKDEQPLYVYGEDFLQKTSHSVVAFAKNALRQVLESPDSRNIFYFLCANLAFCGVEFVYGVLTNSLGLISDGFHMLFDCSALVMGLVASVMSRWPASRLYSYGYGRVEVLSGFINALFLVVIAFFIFLEALERVFDPPQVHTEKLLFVSVAGLVVNLFGIFAFSHAHSHGGGGGDHGHSHEHGHSHGGGKNANMQGVFLHVLADTLGSVAVIISSLLIEYFGWLWVDPVCSLGLSVLILLSVLPLLGDSASVLLQRTPTELEDEVQEALDTLVRLEGVTSYSRAHVWQLKSDLNVASVHVQVSTDAAQQRITQQLVNLLRQTGAQQVLVQVEKEPFFQHITALCPNYEIPQRVSKNPLHETLMVKAI